MSTEISEAANEKNLLPLVLGALAFPVVGRGNAALPSQGSVHSYRHISQAEARKMMEAEPGHYRPGIATSRTMRQRTDALLTKGTDAEIEVFNGLAHAFGLGTGTAAGDWIDRATAFWEWQMPQHRNGQ